MFEIFQHLDSMTWVTFLITSAIAIGLVVHYILFFVFGRLGARTRSILDDSLIKHCRKPSMFIFPLIAIQYVKPMLRLSPDVLAMFTHLSTLAMIASVAWLFVSLTNVLNDRLKAKYPEDGLDASKAVTRFYILKRVLTVTIIVVAVSIMLLTFEGVRAIGASILASAGIAALLAGIAVRPALSNLLAGIQIAFTEPIKLNDAVIVENDWGWIEEIAFTYVTVRTWDMRRLIVPISHFTEKPFQNWTKAAPDLLAVAYLYVDYTIPVKAIRDELLRVLKTSKLWDGKSWALHVTDAKEYTMQLRAIMGAPDAGAAFDLQCEVREKLLDFIQRKYPQSLPRLRTDIEHQPEATWSQRHSTQPEYMN